MSGQALITQLVVSALVAFVFAVSVLGLALGLGLIVRSAATLAFIGLMNRWVSIRQALQPLEAPRRVARPAGTTRWFGVFLVAVGAYAALVVLGTFDVPRLAALLKMDPRYSLASLALETLKWLLVLGSLGGVATGLMLLFAPGAWRTLEERANRWYSTGNLELAGDRPYMSLDRMVEARPRAAGWVIFALSLLAAVASGILLFARH
jgi:hypothetical protein